MRILLYVIALLGLTACVGSLTSGTPPLYYEIDFPSQPIACTYSFNAAIKVWPFSASAPYDREEMIVLDSSRQVRFSSQYRWIALPGAMISDRLLADLSKGSLFIKAVEAGNAFNPSMELGGHVFRFAWEERDSSARAVLEVEVSLWTEEPKRDILFRKHYNLDSGPVPKGSSAEFAEAMSRLAQKLSLQLQEDLCSTLSKGSSFPAGG